MKIARKSDQLCQLFLYSPIINNLIQTSTSPYFGLYLQVYNTATITTSLELIFIILNIRVSNIEGQYKSIYSMSKDKHYSLNQKTF